MIRPARPGDRCFLLRDPIYDGRNIGKTCLVLEQCRCDASDWKVETLEPWILTEIHTIGGALFDFDARCPAGTTCCVPKPDLRPITDPDQETDDVSHLSPADHSHDHPA